MRVLPVMWSLFAASSVQAQSPEREPPPQVVQAPPVPTPVLAAPLRCTTCEETRTLGVVVFAVSYASTLIYGGWHEHELYVAPVRSFGEVFIRPVQMAETVGLALPIAGPFVGGLVEDDPRWKVLAFADASLQALGLVLIVAGIGTNNAWEREHPLSVAPLVGPGVSGAALSGRF